MAETFTFMDEEGKSLSEVAQLDTLITVVDALRFDADLNSLDDLCDHNLGVDEDDTRSIVDLLVDQVYLNCFVQKGWCAVQMISISPAGYFKNLLEEGLTELIMIGQNLDKADLTQRLNECLPTKKWP